MPQTLADTLYYDGKCALCAREIAYLRRLCNPQLRLIDVHSASEESLQKLGTSKKQMLRILHLQSCSGELLLGLDATVRAWSHTRVGWLFAVLRWPVIKPLADKIYFRWAEKRACALGYSDLCDL